MISIRKHYPQGAVLGHSFFNFLKYSLGKTITFAAQTLVKRVKKIKEIKEIKKMIARTPPSPRSSRSSNEAPDPRQVHPLPSSFPGPRDQDGVFSGLRGVSRKLGKSGSHKEEVLHAPLQHTVEDHYPTQRHQI
jgi:hypothetical protein